jgi:hypothetical protein
MNPLANRAPKVHSLHVTGGADTLSCVCMTCAGGGCVPPAVILPANPQIPRAGALLAAQRVQARETDRGRWRRSGALARR